MKHLKSVSEILAQMDSGDVSAGDVEVTLTSQNMIGKKVTHALISPVNDGQESMLRMKTTTGNGSKGESFNVPLMPHPAKFSNPYDLLGVVYNSHTGRQPPVNENPIELPSEEN